jgi:hypothetical protein
MSKRSVVGHGQARFPGGEGRERVRQLHVRGFTPSEIAKQLDMTRQAVNYHLKRLAKEAS